MATEGELLIDEDFTKGMENWWSEGNEKVWVEDGHLYQKVDSEEQRSGTVWCSIPHPDDCIIEYGGYVISSSLDVNNLNFFFSYNYSEESSLYETRDERQTGRYKLYHDMPGYIITYLNDADGEGGLHADGTTQARSRFRKNPGFQLLWEQFGFLCRQEEEYQFRIEKRGGDIAFSVNGEQRFLYADPEPLGGGFVGFRSFRSFIRWDYLKLYSIT